MQLPYFVLLLFFPLTQGKNVLLLPSMIHSHVLELIAIGEGLANKGHQVVIAMHKGETINAHGQVRIIFYGRDDETGVHLGSYSDALVESIGRGVKYDSKNFINRASQVQCQSILRDTTFHNQLKSMLFDFVIVDGFLPVRCLYIIPKKLKIPYASVTAHIPMDLIGSMLSLPSIHANLYYNSNRKEKMGFIDRVRNTVDMIFYCMMVSMNYEPADYHQHHRFKSLADLANQSELWIINSDPFLDSAFPSLPHVIYAGGLTATRTKQSMSEGLRIFIENAQHGVVIVSFGSLLPKLPDTISEKFLNVFAKLKQRVVWRHTGTLPRIPPNVRIEEWIPQLALLEHKHTRILISHCEGTGQYEAVFFGIPMIGFPLFSNHDVHAKRMVDRGIGVLMKMTVFTEIELHDNIVMLLTNSTYSDNVGRLSQMLKDRPTALRDVAIYWVDHVIKYGGTHLRNIAADMTWKEIILLDVSAFLAIIGFTFALTFYVICSCICRRICRSKVAGTFIRRQRTLSVTKLKKS